MSHIQPPLGMKSTLQSFLVFLRNLVSFFRKRWTQSTGRLWYILTFLRSRSLSRHPKERDKLLRSNKPRPANPSPTTVICASRLPPPLTPIFAGDTPIIASPTPISIEVRQPTILITEDTPDESYENGAGHLHVDGSFLGGSRQFSRSSDLRGYHDEPDPTHVVLSPNREEFTSNPHATLSRTISRASSRNSYHPPSQYAGYGPWSQYSHHQPSEDSFRSPLNGAEAAARGFLPRALSPRPSSLLSVRPPSVASSAVSHVYRASRPAGRVRRPSPMTNAPRRRSRSRTPTLARQNLHEVPPNAHVPESPETESQTTGSIHRDRSGVVVGFGPLPAPEPEGSLRPMLQIDRYEKHGKVIVEDAVSEHVFPPVTAQFPRWVFFGFPAVHRVCLDSIFQGVSS